MKLRALAIGCLILVAGCAAMPPQQLGQVVGTVAGSVIAPGIGAPIGGLIGLLSGMVVQKKVDQVTEQRERVELGRQLQTHPVAGSPGGEVQSMLSGIPTRVWVDETWRDGRVVAGSFEERDIP
jgi:hypothetical protein